ncbi:MAG: VanW family protein [Patescibacteria group bacterium]|nr:VanW family protein [Patescibacteria group bacterium]
MKSKKALAIGIPVTIALTGVVLLAPLFFLRDVASPGTELFGVDVSYKNSEEIRQIFDKKLQEFSTTPQQIIIEGEHIETTPESIGVRIDLEDAISQVSYIGEAGIASVIGSLHLKKEIEEVVDVDREKVLAIIHEKIGDRKIQEPKLFSGEDKILQVMDGKSGVKIDEDHMWERLYQNISTLSAQPVVVRTVTTTPEVSAEEIRANLEEIEAKLREEKTLKYGKNEYKISLIDHLDWISFKKEKDYKFEDLFIPLRSGTEDLYMHLDRHKIYKYVEENIEGDIDFEAEHVAIWINEEGSIGFEGTPEDGQAVQKNTLVQMLELALNEGVNELNIPVKTLKGEARIAKDLQARGIKELIGVGHTTFYGSPANRIHNIRTGISKYNGLLIPQGETFSFNEHLGFVDAITGFLPELVIKPEGTLPEYGGGLCQVSTTLYRAAIFTGLPIVERENHSYAVSYYSQLLGYGLDATTYPGVHDVKFINDTPGDILVQAYTDGMHAYYKFYGTSDGRKVHMEGPYISNYVKPPEEPVYIETDKLPPGEEKQSEKPHTGFDVLWYRYIEKSSDTIQEKINTRYKAVPEKIMVGREKPPN